MQHFRFIITFISNVCIFLQANLKSNLSWTYIDMIFDFWNICSMVFNVFAVFKSKHAAWGFYQKYQNEWKIVFLVRRLIKFNGSLYMQFSILWSHILGKVRPHIVVNGMIYHFSWVLAYMSIPGGAKGIRHPVDRTTQWIWYW